MSPAQVLEKMLVAVLDPDGIVVEEFEGDLDSVTDEVTRFAQSMLVDGLDFSVRVITAPRSGCKNCAKTVARIDNSGQVVCAACGLPTQE